MRAGMALACVAAVALGGCNSSTSPAQTLRLEFKAGADYRYTLTTTSAWTQPQVMSSHMTAMETATVRSVDASGNSELTITLSDVVVDGAAYDQQVMSLDLTIAPDGRLISLNGKATTGNYLQYVTLGYGGKALITAVLPDKPVRPGDAWNTSFDVPEVGAGARGGVHVTARSTYLGDETLMGVRAAMIETKSTAAFDASGDVPSGHFSIKGTTSVDVITWLDPATHRILESGATVTTSTVQVTTNAAGFAAEAHLQATVMTKLFAT